MTNLMRNGIRSAALAALALVAVSGARGASLYMSVVAETFGPEAANFAAGPASPVTYAALDGGYIDSGDPIGGVTGAPPAMVGSALAQALAQRGYQPAPGGSAPALLIVYHWGEIRHDSIQVQPPDRLKGNDRARLNLLARTSDAKKIESSIITDRLSRSGVGAMTRTEQERETLQLAADSLSFVVVSAYDMAALQRREVKLVWQTKMTSRAVGQTMSEALVTLINHSGPYFGRDEKRRVTLKKELVQQAAISIGAVPPGWNQLPNGLDAAFVQTLVTTEHARWSGRYVAD